MGVLQFNVDELFEPTFKTRNILTGENPVFPYTRAELQECRRKKREEMEQSTSSKSNAVCIIDSDEEYVCLLVTEYIY